MPLCQAWVGRGIWAELDRLLSEPAGNHQHPGLRGLWVLRMVLGPTSVCPLSQMKMLDSENARMGRELAELQGRLVLGERAEKEGRREALGLRQKLLKGEASLEAVRQEVTSGWVGCLEWKGPRRQSGCPVPSPAGPGRESTAGVILRDPSLGLVPVPDSLRFFRRYNSNNNNCTNWAARGAL